MSESLSPDMSLEQSGKTVEEVEVKTITLYEAVGAFLLRTAPIIKELGKYGLPSKLLDRLKEEWIDLDLIHGRLG